MGANPMTNKTPITLRALNGAVGRTAVWVSCWLLFELLALTVAMGWFDWMSGALQSRYAPGSLMNDLGANFRTDHAEEISAASQYAAGLGAVLAPPAVLPVTRSYLPCPARPRPEPWPSSS